MNDRGRGQTPHFLELSATILRRRRRRRADATPTIILEPSSRAAGLSLADPRTVQAANDHRNAAAPPPETPRQGQSKPHRDGDGVGGQKLRSVVTTSAAATTPRAAKPTRSRDPGAQAAGSSTAPTKGRRWRRPASHPWGTRAPWIQKSRSSKTTRPKGRWDADATHLPSPARERKDGGLIRRRRRPPH